MPPALDLTPPTLYEGSSRIVLLDAENRDKIIYKDEVDRIVAQIPLSRMDAEDIGFESEWRAAARLNKRYYWKIVLLRKEPNDRQSLDS